jgi:RNAse (barnase) inhibitor barstar
VEKKVYILDGDRFDNLDEFYDEITTVLIPDIGFEWGRNFDAFADIFCGGFGLPAEGYIVTWKNSVRSQQTLGYDLTIRYLEEIWNRVAQVFSENEMRQLDYEMLKQLYPDADAHWLQQKVDNFSGGNLGRLKQLDLARQHEGPTIFDDLVAIFKRCSAVELRLE